MKIKITNSEPKLVSFWDIYGKELEVKDTKTVQFASGPKTYYIADFEGREYEVPEDMVETKRKPVINPDIVRDWGGDWITDGQILAIEDALRESDIEPHQYFRIKNFKSPDQEGQYLWARVDALRNEIRPGMEPADISEEQIKNILWAMIQASRDVKAGNGKRVEDIKVGDVVEFIEPEEEEEGVTYNVLELRGDRVLVNDNINTEMEVRPTYVYLINDLKKVDKAGDGTKIEKMEIKNQYDGKSPEQVWDAWTKHQREHFCIDHNLMDNMSVRQFKMSSSELKNEIWGKEFRNVNTWDYWILPTLADHVVVGQYGKGGPIPENKYYYLPIGRIFKDSGGVRFQISGYTPEALKIKRYSEVEKDTAEAELSFGAVPTLAEDKKITFEGATLETWRDMRLLELEIDSIKKHLALVDTTKTYQEELEQAKSEIDLLNAELSQVKREADTLLGDVQKTKASAKDSLDAMEAIAKKEKKTNLTYNGISETEIEENYGKLAGPNQLSKKEHEYFKKLHKALLHFEKTPGSKFYMAGKGAEISRITWGEEEVHDLNNEPIPLFIKKYEGTGKDIFFTNSGEAYVTNRTSNLSYHGKDAGKRIEGDNVKFVYCALENEFHSLENYKKLIKGVYHGVKARVKPININLNNNASKGTQVSPCSDCDTKLKAFIAKFPNNAKSWAQATDEMRDLARELREYYNDHNNLNEGDKGYIDGLPFREFKTPSEWNTKAKKQILSTWKKLSKEQKQQFAESNSFLNPDND